MKTKHRVEPHVIRLNFLTTYNFPPSIEYIQNPQLPSPSHRICGWTNKIILGLSTANFHKKFLARRDESGDFGFIIFIFTSFSSAYNTIVT